LARFLVSQSVPKLTKRLVISVNWGWRTHGVFGRIRLKPWTTRYYGRAIGEV
jgi:hypothetical protein